MGLYRIPSPPTRIRANLLALPRTASLVAIDLMRTSFTACARMPWSERLAWYFDVGTSHVAPSAEATRRSSRVLTHARDLYLRYFGDARDSFSDPLETRSLSDGTVLDVVQEAS